MLKELEFLINDVREQTDNTDVNGIKDREIVRYFNDGVKTIQALIFKNNPLCSYFQEPVIYSPIHNIREYDLPTDCFGDNAVSMVELEGTSGNWYPIDRVWPEDGLNFFGWFTRNRQIIISGREDRSLSQRIRVWYFKRLPRFDKSWASVTSVVGQTINLTGVDAELFKIDRFASFLTIDGELRVAAIPFKKASATSLTVVGNVSTVVATDLMVMGRDTRLTVELPEEVEPFLMDYVAQRIAGRNSYGEDWNKLNFWTAEERANITAIFADASQAITRAPITDTEYMKV